MRRKRKKQRKSKIAKGHRAGVTDGPLFLQNPISEMPPDELRAALIGHAAESSKAFESLLSNTITILKTYDPLQIINTLSRYGLAAAVDGDGNQTPIVRKTRIIQSHVELIQALALTVPAGELAGRPPDPLVIQQLFDQLPKLAQSFADRRLAALSKNHNEADKAILSLQEHLRLHTQHVRNWGYLKNVLRIVSNLYEPLDSVIKAKIGLSAREIVCVFVSHIRALEKHNSKALMAIGRIARKTTVESRIREYCRLYPNLQGASEDLIALARQERLDVDRAMGLILAHLDFCATMFATMESRAVAAALNADASAVVRVLDSLSIQLGALAETSIDHLFLDNPVWLKPLIRLSDGRYFCAMPQMFFSFVRPIFDELMKADPELMRQVADRRAEFLENEIARLFARAFPGGEVSSGFRWKSEGIEYENDLLVRVDSHLFIVEAKSGIVSAPALRGAPDRAKKHITELIIEPSQQSARMAEKIRSVLRTPELQGQHFPGIGIDLSRVRRIVRLSVTLDDFGTVQSNLHELRSTGWIPVGHSLAPCMHLADLEVIFDILESSGQKINYLMRRAELVEKMRTIGDELDHLGLYLSTGFNIGEVESGDAILQLDQMSQVVDDYCVPLSDGIRRPKPKMLMTKWWSDMCAFVERRAFWRWSEAINILLSVTVEGQREAERMFEQVKYRHRRDRDPSSQDTVFIAPPARKGEAIAFFAFRDVESNARHQRMSQIAMQAFENNHVERCLVIAISVDRNDHPYNTLMVFDRSEPTCGEVRRA